MVQPNNTIFNNNIEDDEPKFGWKCRLNPGLVGFPMKHPRFGLVWFEEHGESSDEELRNDGTATGNSTG